MELRQRDCHAALDGYVSLCEEQFAAHDASVLSCEGQDQYACFGDSAGHLLPGFVANTTNNSLGMVAILVPATIVGLNIGFAVLLHEGSTLVVVINALRLLVYENLLRS